MALTLYAHPLSNYSQKALIALYELDLPFTFRMLDPRDEATSTELATLWPLGKFPVLVDDGKIFPEASLIVEHLDRIAGGGRLVPDDYAACMEMRLMDRVFDNYIATPQGKIIADRMRPAGCNDPKGVEDAHAMLEKIFGWLDGKLQDRVWSVGEAFSLADCAAAPMLFYADWVHPIADAYPALLAYYQRLRERPSVVRAVNEARPYHAFVPGGVPEHVSKSLLF